MVEPVLPIVLMNMMLTLPPHEPTRNREKERIDSSPRNQYRKVHPNPRMQIEQDLPTPFHNVMQRPDISPSVKPRLDIQVVESGRDVGDDPEDEPQSRPRLSDEHCRVFAGQAERDHAEEVEHPVDGKSAVAVCVGVVVAVDRPCGDGVRADGIAAGEVDLEGQADERVGQGEEEVRRNSRAPAPEDQMGEFEDGVSLGSEVSKVDWQVESEGEEGDDDEVDQADRDGWDSSVREERP